MNIYAEPGDKVIYAHPKAGWEYDRERCQQLLTPCQRYTVAKVVVGSFATDVYLKEVPSVGFNSVMFEDAE